MKTLTKFDFGVQYSRKKRRPANALKNGTRHRLKLGQLPTEMRSVTRQVNQYRRLLEEACDDQHGEVSLTHAHLIDAAAKHQQHALVCQWLLRKRIDKMSTNDIRECSNQIGKSSDKRNAAVQALDLDAPPPNPWDAIDALPLLDKEDDHDQHECSQDGEAVHEETETSTQETEEEDDHEQD